MCYLTLCKGLKSRKLRNLFVSDFFVLWHHFCLICKTHKWKEKKLATLKNTPQILPPEKNYERKTKEKANKLLKNRY